MYKYFRAIFFSLLSFYAIKGFLDNRKLTPDSLEVVVNAEVQENDIFYVYYTNESHKQWSDNHSRHIRIKGSEKLQNFTFILPLELPSKRIRIDIGANKEQAPIKIESIILKSKVGQQTISGNYEDHFKLNAYASYENELYVPNIVSGRYDPFLVSNENTNLILEQLQKTRPMFSPAVSTLLALVFSLALFVFMVFSLSGRNPDYFVATFILIIVAPFLANLFDVRPIEANLEKRELAKMPEIRFDDEFPQDFESFFNDNFGLRNLIIQGSGKIKINVFRSSPKPELVQFGKGEFLFYNDLNDEIFNSYTHQNVLKRSDLEVYYSTFEGRKEQLAKLNITYVVGFWPNKHSIYPELLPGSMKSQIQGPFSLADQITEYFKKNDAQFFDVRESLLNAKSQSSLYRKFDTHWNSDGAFVGYRSFCEQTAKTLRLTPFERIDFEIIYEDGYSGDLTEQIGVEQIAGYSDEVPKYRIKNEKLGFKQVSSKGYPNGSVVTKNPNAEKKQRLVVFRDSFTSQLIQFLSLHYTEVIYLKEKYDKNLIERLEPDVVLSCRVERYMLFM
jgi:hypothetical protein